MSRIVTSTLLLFEAGGRVSLKNIAYMFNDRLWSPAFSLLSGCVEVQHEMDPLVRNPPLMHHRRRLPMFALHFFLPGIKTRLSSALRWNL